MGSISPPSSPLDPNELPHGSDKFPLSRCDILPRDDDDFDRHFRPVFVEGIHRKGLHDTPWPMGLEPPLDPLPVHLPHPLRHSQLRNTGLLTIGR